jgi:hypothetical protein
MGFYLDILNIASTAGLSRAVIGRNCMFLKAYMQKQCQFALIMAICIVELKL